MLYNTDFGYVSESALGPRKTKETLGRVGRCSTQQSGFQIPNLNSNCSPYACNYFIANQPFLYNRDGECSLYGTNWAFIENITFRPLKAKITWLGLIKGNVELEQDLCGFLNTSRLKSSYYAETGNKAKGQETKFFYSSQYIILHISHYTTNTTVK